MSVLTNQQKDALCWLVTKIEAGHLEAQFHVMWDRTSSDTDATAKIWRQGIIGETRFFDGVSLTRSILNALAAEGFISKKDSPADITQCFVTGRAFRAVHNNFADIISWKHRSDEIASSFLLHINTTLGSATQALYGIVHIDRAIKDQYTHLLGQLKDALVQVPPGLYEDAEALAEIAQDLVAVASREYPNRRRLEITVEALKRAVEPFERIAPDVMTTISLIIVIVSTQHDSPGQPSVDSG